MKKIKAGLSKKKAARLQMKLDQAINLQVQGNFVASEELLQQVLATNPKCAPAYHYLALIAKEFKAVDAAFSLFEQSIALDNKNAEVYYNYAVMLALEGRLGDAEKAYECAVLIDKKMDVAWFNLANTYFKNNKYDHVRYALNQFLKIPNHHVELYPNVARYYFDIGDIESTKDVCSHALAANIAQDEVLWTLINAEQNLQNVENFLTQVKAVKLKTGLKDELIMRLTIYQAIGEWQLGLLEECQISIDATNQWLAGFKPNPINQSLLSYRFFLSQLLIYSRNNPSREPSNKDIYLIGDSHSLSNSNQTILLQDQLYKTTSKLLFGCKAFHLAQKNYNKFKASFEHAINTVPDGGTVIMMIGEIDCRVNEGILPVFKKGQQELTTLVQETVRGYVSFVLSRTQPRNIEVYFYGVPASRRMGDTSESDMEILKNIILLFNQTLLNCALQTGNKFINIYKLTANNSGLTDGLYHIDDFHLLPKCLEAAEVTFLR